MSEGTWTYRHGVVGILHLRLVKFHLLLCHNRLGFCVLCMDHFQKILGQYFGTSDLALVWSTGDL